MEGTEQVAERRKRGMEKLPELGCDRNGIDEIFISMTKNVKLIYSSELEVRGTLLTPGKTHDHEVQNSRAKL